MVCAFLFSKLPRQTSGFVSFATAFSLPNGLWLCMPVKFMGIRRWLSTMPPMGFVVVAVVIFTDEPDSVRTFEQPRIACSAYVVAFHL